MATKESAKDDKVSEAPKKSSKIIVLLLVALIVVVLGVGGVVAYVINKKATPEKKVEEHKEEVEPSFLPMDSFTVNLKGNQERFAQVFLTISITDPKDVEPIKARSPILRDRILRIIGKKTAEDLMTSEGKEKLANEILVGIKESLPAEMKKSVKEVLFTNFIIQ